MLPIRKPLPLIAHFVVKRDDKRRVLVRARVPSVDVAREAAALRANNVIELTVWQGNDCLWKD